MKKTTTEELTLIRKTTVKWTPEQLKEVTAMLKKYKRVRVLDFGTFEIRKIPAKTMYNTIVGKKITIKGRNRVVFTAFDSLSKNFNVEKKPVK
jgi:nucleoid DNA-binding protein